MGGSSMASVGKIGTQRPVRRVFERVMTTSELAQYFGVSKARVYEMLRRQANAGFPSYRVGRGWRVDLEQMREWICQRVEDKAPGIPTIVSPRMRP
jgi:excisionase family DNA binding protein